MIDTVFHVLVCATEMEYSSHNDSDEIISLQILDVDAFLNLPLI